MDKTNPRISCVAFVDDSGMIKSAFNINKMEKNVFGLLILEIEHLLKKLKEKYYSGGEEIEKEDKE